MIINDYQRLLIDYKLLKMIKNDDQQYQRL